MVNAKDSYTVASNELAATQPPPLPPKPDEIVVNDGSESSLSSSNCSDSGKEEDDSDAEHEDASSSSDGDGPYLYGKCKHVIAHERFMRLNRAMSELADIVQALMTRIETMEAKLVAAGVSAGVYPCTANDR